jgi:hypothetical protein
MLIPTPHYGGFSACNHLEELTLQLGREILEIQKDNSINTKTTSVIDIIGSESVETTTIKTINWIGQLVNGLLRVVNPFPSHDFIAGTGSYPFNQPDLVNAFFHVACYHQKMELSVAKNAGSKQFIDFEVINSTTLGATSQLELSLIITELPIYIINQSDQTVTKAKPYLV